ncbi:M23 family metallopeptidase [Urechidicola croceus]|uniref:Peptidase M23 n=1 Tax=Urechidicola croceus TaxID=1850246 RepID=A0A1D8P895_9FLAO|nr:M23 family metallopeptidase [Urechidicola croceus]AOW20798.1 peptidase M23 [Urechidicola croceus]
MAKVKYHYDSETLSYKKIERKRRTVFTKFFGSVVAFGLAMILGYVVLSRFFETPGEKVLKREYEFLKLNYASLEKKQAEFEHVLEDLQVRDNNIYRTFFELNPIPEEQRTAGFGGVNRYKSLQGFEDSKLVTDITENMDILSKQLYIQSKSLDEIVKLAKNKEELLAAIPAIQPVKNEDLTRMASGYGWRTDPFLKTRKKHYGMDFTAPRGTPVFATGPGKVTRADQSASGFGKHIRIDHGFGYTSLYAHLSKYNVRKGQKVKRGDLIGFVGNTGRSQAPHLHYEIRKNKERINPINFYYGNLSPKEFEAMQKAAQIEGQSLD